MRRRRLISALLLLPLVFSAGCATYHYDVVQPEELASRVTKQPREIDRPPLVYEMRAVEDRLVIRIFNQAPGPVTLLGDRSYVITPEGQSIPLDSRTIAPGTFTKLILPPVPPRIQRVGPSVGFGVGYSTGSLHHPRHRINPYMRHHYHHMYHDPAPHYLLIQDAERYWDWRGESYVTLHFVYETPSGPLTHTFLIHRVKV